MLVLSSHVVIPALYPLSVLLPPHLRAQYVNNRPVNETGWSYKLSCSNSVREYNQRQSRMIGWQSDCSSGAAFCSHTTDMATELCGKIQSLMNIYENFFIKSNYMCNYMMNNSGWATYCDGTLISHVELLMPGSNISWSTYTKPECIWNPMSRLLCNVGPPEKAGVHGSLDYAYSVIATRALRYFLNNNYLC